MSVTEFKRGVPTYKDKDDNEFGLLCETKEVCVTDNDGVSLEYKLQTLMQNINNIISGANQVGNAKNLDGHEVEYFVNRTDVLTGSESILEKTKTLSYGMWNFRFNNHDGTDLPNVYYANGCATVFVRTSSHITVVLWGSYYNTASRIQSNYYNGVVWTGWKAEAIDTDLANYLPLIGGVIGNGTDHYPLVIKGNDAKRATIGFRDNSNNTLGYLGFLNADNLVFFASDSKGLGNGNAILHTGNSAKVVVSETAPSDTSALWVW